MGSPTITVVVIPISRIAKDPKKTGGLMAAPNNVFLSLLKGSLIDHFLIVNHGVLEYTVVQLIKTNS